MLKQGWVALGLLVAAVIWAMITSWRLLYHVSYALAFILVLSLLLTLNDLIGVQVARLSRTHRSQVGKHFDEEFTLVNRGWFPKRWLEVRDHSTLPGHRAGRVISGLGPRQRYIWAVRTYCGHRGRFRLGPLSLHSGDPFGFFFLSRRLAGEGELIVYPYTVDLPGLQLPFGELSGGTAMRRRTQHVTDQVAGVREYVHGDSFNRIHWKSTARVGRLISKEFELEPVTDIWLYLDLEQHMHVSAPWAEEMDRSGPAVLWGEHRTPPLPPSTAEYAVSAAASLAKQLLSMGRAVGLVAYGQKREVMPADRGPRQLVKLLEALAVLEARGTVPISLVLEAEARHLHRGTGLIVITPAFDVEWVRVAQAVGMRGVRLAAVLIAGESFAPAPSIAPVQAALQSSGILCTVVRRGDDLAERLRFPAGG